MPNIFDNILQDQKNKKRETMSFSEFLDLCKKDKSTYASAAERMLAAIGEPEIVDTSKDPRLSRIFLNRTLRVYPAFSDFYGMEETIERIVGYFRHAAQGLEEKKQVLYLLGPVGGGKSSLAERLKDIITKMPIYVLTAADGTLSPVFETPLGVFDPSKYSEILREEYGIDSRYLSGIMSPWAIKRLKEYDGDISKFKVTRLWPSKLEQIGVIKTEPGDDNNQDISSLVGKTNIRMLERFDQNDPDSYSFSGALCRGNQGIMEFVEMFKAPIKMLHPLLTATQEGNYIGTEAISAIPFNGIVLAHCFSEDTEILTKNGFKKYSDIDVGDTLATMNMETGKMEYQPAINKYVYDYEGDMVYFNSNSMDHLVTPNHKMAFHTQYTKNWKFCLAGDFGNTGKVIPVSAANTLDDYNVSDDMLRLMVWTITDGRVRTLAKEGPVIEWHLAKTRKIERLCDLLSRMQMDYTVTNTNYVTTGGLNTVTVRANNIGIDKNIPDFYNLLSARQCRVFLEEYSHTDGSRNDNRGNTVYDNNTEITHYQLSSNKQHDIDCLQHMAFMAGYKSSQSKSVYTDGRYEDQKFLSIRLGVTETRSDYAKNDIFYKGKVFCFETPNHTLIARRNGKVIITGNSNEAEWQTFKNNKNNEAFIDRIYVVKVPYCLRVSDEVNIYKKMLENSSLRSANCSPQTLEILSRFCVLTRLNAHENSSVYSKMRVYDGEAIKDVDPKARSMQEYRDAAGVDEGMGGISTRFAFKILSKTFNFDPAEVAADPVHLMYVMEESIRREQFGSDTEERYLDFIKDYLAPKYADFIGNELQKAYLESYSDYGQNLFDRYIEYADAWIQEIDFKDADTGNLYDREILNKELEKIEKPAGIANPKDFRHEVVNFVLRARAKNNGVVSWTSYEKLREVIEKKMFASVEELLPIISFSAKSNNEDQKKHDEFVERMISKGYTAKSVRRLVEWYMRVQKSS